MNAPRALGLLVALTALFTRGGDADACSCADPRTPVLVTPDRADDVPLNAHVRYDTFSMPGNGSPGVQAVLRVHGGAVVETTARTIEYRPAFFHIELIPRAPLAPHTQYEIARSSGRQYPAEIVFGTFRTGDARDAIAPLFDPPWGVDAYAYPSPQSMECEIWSPWAIVKGVSASDPERPHAQLVYGVWTADAAGNIDPKKPPATVLQATGDLLQIGGASLCDLRRFPLPAHGVVTLGIAAIDEAGNVSPLRRVRVDTRQTLPPP